MLWVGLSGGIGSGKSTVSSDLARRGAVIIDADRIAREVVEPGTPALDEIRARFGDEVLTSAGALDRPALGALVFADAQARRDLEAITHPRITQRTVELVGAAPQDAVVVHDIPLLVELGREADYALTVIVDVPARIRLRRLVELRGMGHEQARQRIEAQATDQQRRQAADVLLDNAGSFADLRRAVDRLWRDRLVPFEDNLRHGRMSRRPERLTIVAADPGWPAQASRLLNRVRHALGEAVVRADHIGSTAVPQLEAKDVIDLQVVLRDLSILDDPAIVRRLERVGFVVTAGQAWDHAHGESRPAIAAAPGASTAASTGPAFVAATAAAIGAPTLPKRMLGSADPARVVHCHVRPVESPAWRLALLFRDWLAAVPEERERYALLKAQHLEDGLSSTEHAAAKEPWFAQAFERAEAWAASSAWQPGA